MMIKRFFQVLIGTAILSLSSQGQDVLTTPQFFQKKGVIQNSAQEVVVAAPEFRPQVVALVEALKSLGAKKVKIVSQAGGKNGLSFSKGELPKGTSYEIRWLKSGLSVVAKDQEAAAQAVATILQTVIVKDGAIQWPRIDVKDGPSKNLYRSFMIDMGRNPHSPKVVKQMVDVMWLYKVNYLHLHLSDDQLFSWPSKIFPKLYSKRAGWTWEDFVELEAYSQARGVTIIPEIDVPGHSGILRRKYPEVFGKSITDLAKNPEAQKGVEALIDEMLSVFKATPYVHIGGDEAYGVPENLQRNFINRLNAFVKSRGKRTVAWEGPHEGHGEHKVDEDVLHINWRTINFPAQKMLDAGYDVVNAAWDPLYIVDHYPRTMFTAVDMKRCYEWNRKRFAHINHGMSTFSKPHTVQSDERIVGFCMPWWEGREENMLPLCVPRLAAVAAAAWNRDGEKDFAAFQQRYAKSLVLLEKISGIKLPALPVASPESQKANLAYLAKVSASDGDSQPHFGPQRLTNGLTDQFDHFLGFPTQPKALEIQLELKNSAKASRVVIHERAINGSYEIYRLFVSADGKSFHKVGESKKGTRGKNRFVEHKFDAQKVKYVKIETDGCHGLTFPSFSRLTEVEVFE